jgi:hypothetical protein
MSIETVMTNLVFIRFNPDSFHDSDGKLRKISLEKRMITLNHEISKWMHPDQEQEHLFHVVFLYYDAEMKREDFVPAAPDEYQQKMAGDRLQSFYYAELRD